MGQIRVIFTDATTAEAISVFKTMGYLETSEGGCFRNPSNPLKIYSLWGKAPYYPDLLNQLSFTPRIQVHVRSPEESSLINELLQAVAQGFLALSEETEIVIFDAGTGEKITPALLQR